jgi:hypothetical protein
LDPEHNSNKSWSQHEEGEPKPYRTDKTKPKTEEWFDKIAIVTHVFMDL